MKTAPQRNKEAETVAVQRVLGELRALLRCGLGAVDGRWGLIQVRGFFYLPRAERKPHRGKS